MKLRDDGSNCPNCFVENCDCECDTCVAARGRNKELSPVVLMILNVADALKVKKEDAEGS